MTAIRTNANRLRLKTLACGWCLLLAGTADGLEIEAQFSAGVGTTDNIGRDTVNEMDETTGVAGLNFGLTENSARLTADIRSQFDYMFYVDDTFDNELVGGLAANAEYTLLEERLTWMLQDNFGQQTSNPFAAANPGNREDVNFFTTGPTLSFQPGGRNIVQVNARYSRVDFETRDTDDERTSVAMQLGRDIRRGTRLSLNASTERVEFSNGGVSSDYDRLEGFVRYELDVSRNTLGVDLGYTEIDSEGSVSDGLLARLDWTRQVSSDTIFVLSGGTSFSDQGDIFRFDQGNATDLRDTTDIFATAAPFTSNFVTASYAVTKSRTSINIAINWREEDYEGGQPIDQHTTGANFNLRRDFSQSLFGGISAQYQRRNFKYLNSADDNVTISTELGYRFGPALSASLQYSYFERSGDTAVVEATENRITLRFFYTPAWGR